MFGHIEFELARCSWYIKHKCLHCYLVFWLFRPHHRTIRCEDPCHLSRQYFEGSCCLSRFRFLQPLQKCRVSRLCVYVVYKINKTQSVSAALWFLVFQSHHRTIGCEDPCPLSRHYFEDLAACRDSIATATTKCRERSCCLSRFRLLQRLQNVASALYVFMWFLRRTFEWWLSVP